MKTRGLGCALKAGAIAALLAGCEGAPTPLLAPGAELQARAITPASDRSKSWMLPEAKSQNLLYVSVTYRSVDVYSYPEAKHVGKLEGFLTTDGLCADPAGDVFIVDHGAQNIYEYGHGGTVAKRTLSDPYGVPDGCSVDPKTGNLAVTNYCAWTKTSGCIGDGTLAIYSHARGTPTVYPYSGKFLFFCGYDDAKNVYVDAYDRLERKHGVLGELPSGGNALKQIDLPKKIEGWGGVQWDGAYLAVGNGRSEIFRIQVLRSKGYLAGIVHLEANYVGQFWIQGSTLIGPNGRIAYGTRVGFWKYPAGGEPTKSIRMLPMAAGAAVSMHPST